MSRKEFTPRPESATLSTPISMFPVGFPTQDVEMAHRDRTNQEITEFIQADVRRGFRVGVAIINGRDRSLRLGHAAVVIQELPNDNANDNQPLIEEDIIPLENNTLLVEGNLYLMHIRFQRSPQGERGQILELALDKRASPLNYDRYIPMFRIVTTLRYLKHIALRCCPEAHSILVSDCATVARNFLADLLDRLKTDGIINDQELAEYKKRWLQHVHIEDGSVGDSEHESRRIELDRSI